MKKRVVIMMGIVFLLSGCDIKLESSAVDPEKYLNNADLPTSIYKKGSDGTVYNLFNFSHTDFGKLILISIEDHPTIKTVELVVQNNNKGAFVVVYDHNGHVDTYTNSSLSINKKYLKPNEDWKIIQNQTFSYLFENTQKGILFSLDIIIKTGERIRITLEENQQKSKKYSFLAVVGADLSDVMRFPFIYLQKAGFISVDKTKIRFRINDKEMKLTTIPITVEGRKSYKIVYALTPLPFFWNEERNIDFSSKDFRKFSELNTKHTQYAFTDNQGHKEIKQITYTANGHSATYKFSPAFPDVMSLKNDQEINGKFCLGIDDIGGIVCGTYSIVSTDDGKRVKIDPKKCWQPMMGSDWVSSYHYDLTIKTLGKGKYTLKSEWVIE